MRDIVWLQVDAHWLAIDKPSGLLSVPGRGADGADCASARVRDCHPDALIVHRLDMGTSGLLLFARDAQAQRSLSQDFAERRVSKRYEAVVAGVVAADSGEISLPLIADWPHRPRQKVCLRTGKPSLTRWLVLQRDPAARTTRLALFPETGRTHQLRVHLQAIGHPILGDELYAPPDEVAAAPRLLLHAQRLEFPDPSRDAIVVVESPPEF